MSKSIILSFYKDSDQSEHKLEISELDLKVLQLHDVTESIRSVLGQFKTSHVVHKFSIAFDNQIEIFESLDLSDAILEGIKLVEDGKVVRDLSVKQKRSYSVEFDGGLVVLLQN